MFESASSFNQDISTLPTVKLHKEGQAVGAPSWAANAAWDAQLVSSGNDNTAIEQMEVILSLSGVSHKYFIWSEGDSSNFIVYKVRQTRILKILIQ